MKRFPRLPWVAGVMVLLFADHAIAQQHAAGRAGDANRGAAKGDGNDSGDPEPPGAKGALPDTMDAIAAAADIPYRPKPPGHMVKFNLQEADLAELVNHISGMTGKRFIYGPKVRQIKATVVSPEPITLEEAYQAFLSILEANGMTVIPQGRFLKIVDSGGVSTQTTPVYSRATPVPDTDRFMTRLYRLQYVSAGEVMGVLQKFKTKDGDITAYEPGQLLIITDTGANISRMIRIIEELDVGGAGQQMWIEPVYNGSAEDLAKQVNELFDLGKGDGGARSGLTKVFADPQTNSLIIVGQEDAYLRLLELMKRLDVKADATGKVRVLPLQHANAEELANTLNQTLQGATKGKGAPKEPGAAGDLFEGELKVTADKSTNSLIITSSGRDYATLRLVIAELDRPRRQVFIEAVIMDLTVSDKTRLGTSWHAGAMADLGGGEDTLFATGLKAENSLGFPANEELLQGFAVGARGPGLEGTESLMNTGVSIPAFGVVLHALTSSGNSNVLATPHIIATDNVAAEINIGENIPLQDNVGGGLGNLSGLLGGQGTGVNALSALSGGLGYSAPRQDVGNKIKVTPHINDSNQVRLEIEQESSARGAASGALGAVTIVKRTASTTVTADDQQTVVIGGLTKEDYLTQDEKIPLLGDIPVLGFLFRHSTTEKRKANLLLILTPYIIRDQNDLRKIFQRKMEERQEFSDRYFVFGAAEWEPPQDFSRANGLVEEVRQAYFRLEEQRRLELESLPQSKPEHEPSEPIDLPADAVSAQPVKGGASPKAPARSTPKTTPRTTPKTTPKPTPRPATRRPAKRSELPLDIRPTARNIGPSQEQVE